MDLNVILFPAPEYQINSLEEYEGELVFIPNKTKSVVDKNFTCTSLNHEDNTISHIPCLL